MGLAMAAGAMTAACQGQNARFDLTGPKVEVRVTRAGVTLPIASVPNLEPGDRLWLHPDLPSTQSVRYLMVLAFLRGTTNPPPDNWFYRIETWDKRVREEGVEITVPKEAQQAVLFLAPVTGGDFTTLRSAVQGRPGIFVRASQDLAAAGFEQARIEKYVASMEHLTPEEAADPKQLQQLSNMIAATLALKPNPDCMKLPPDQQYTCFTQSGGQTLLDDGHGQSIIDALTGSSGAGLIGTASTTQLAGGGLYSAYVGTVVDLVHIMGSLHTAQYQYIPAIALPQQQMLNLRLNTPPSFHNPKSVIVIGLPSVQKTTPPPLRAADPKHVACLEQPGVVLPVEGAPLVFSTGFAHDLVLHINYPKGTKLGPSEQQDIPLTADAARGGLVLATIPKRHALPVEKADTADAEAGLSPEAQQIAELTGAELTGTVRGEWGFDSYTGPTMPLEETPGKDWKLSGDEPVIVGTKQDVQLSSTGTACVESIALESGAGKQDSRKEDKEKWKAGAKPNTVDVSLDVPAHDSGALHLAIAQYGEAKPEQVSLVSYTPPAKIEAVSFHAGDRSAVLSGTSLFEVREVKFDGLTFRPSEKTSGETAKPASGAGAESELKVALAEKAKAPALPVGDHLTAEVALNDGRTFDLPVTVEAPRPSITLLSKADAPPQDEASKSALTIKLRSQDDLPVGDTLVFSMKSARPFPRDGSIEIASPDGSLHTALSLSDPDGALILETPDTLLATLKPLKAFGPSAFGPVRMRAVAPDGTTGDWIPLVTLVRLPTFTNLSCAAAPPAPAATPKKHRPAASDPAGQAAEDAGAPAGDAAAADSAAATAGSGQAGAPTASSDAGGTTASAGGQGPATGAASGSASGITASGTSGAGTSAPGTSGPGTMAPGTSAGSTSAAAAGAVGQAAPADAAQKADASAPAAVPATCTLSGSGLYFLDELATDESYSNPTLVPEGFVGSSLTVPAPTGAVYYLRLRDDPSKVDTLTLPSGPL